MKKPIQALGQVFGPGLLALAAMPALAQEHTAVELGPVQVTATRAPEPVDRVPASVTVIRGDELRARGANDLRTALALVAGVEAPPDGDAGPASAVPSFWGLHEFDAFLLVVDGVPWGGAFNPSIPTLDLNDVERIEVLRGAAPVVYGATAFVGVVQVIHYAAGEAANQAEAGYGSYGTAHGSASLALPQLGDYKQSIAVSGLRRKYSDPRERINNGKFLYRGALPLAGGNLRLDADATIQHAVPTSAQQRHDAELVTPVDANYNPADAHINEHRYHLVLGYSHATPLGQWDTTASYAHSTISDIRGFLRNDFDDPLANPDGAGANADYQSQDRGVIDSYFDTHFTKKLGSEFDLVYGADLLYGSGKQPSVNGAYCAGGAAFRCAPGDDTNPPLATTQRPVDEINGLDDRRAFFGQYVQADWKLDERWDLLGGLRVSETRERKTSTHIDTADATADTYDYDSRSKTKLSGTLGTSYVAWRSGVDEAVVYADYRNTFKPAAIDFGPDVTPAVLSPETARSYEGGLKGHLLNGRLDYEASLFFLHFNNLVLATPSGLQNAGSEIFKGVEFETRYRLMKDLAVAVNYSYHDARFVNLTLEDGTFAGGNRPELSPHNLAAVGLLYTPRQGFNATFVANYVGNRYLDRENDATASSYTTLDATIGYHWRRYGAAVRGYNLGDARKPVTESEFGPDSFYALPARTVLFNLSLDL